MGAGKEWDFEPYPITGSFAEDRWEAFKRNPEWIRTHYGEKVYQEYLRRLTAPDVIDEMMEAYWRTHADTLDEPARTQLLDALDLFAANRRDAQVSTPPERQETP